MAERLALGVIPGVGWSARDIRDVAREAETGGFDGIFCAEANNDALGTAMLMGTATERIQVGTWIANIYLRHPYVCAQGAALISDATGGRCILGLGVSHQPVNGALGVDMQDPPAALRQYTTAVQGWLRGEGPATHVPQRPADPRVPIYVSALTSRIVEMGAELADGIMPLFWSADRVEQSQAWVARGRARAPELGSLDIALGIPTFIGDDAAAMRDVARQHLALFTTFPFFQRLFRASGFAEEADKMEQGAGPASLSDRLLDDICLIGPIDRCRDRLDAFRAAGVTLPILMAPIGVDGARGVIQAFRR
jgi:alkanesulfonate monooxygenase SsuD/methylene tetrahydromethanopterin reductase-like flavin-dependent oxidoreductase (luciferase family)